MATIGAVYEVEPRPRSADDIFPAEPAGQPTPAPEAKNKWLTASVAGTAAQVVSDVFDEAERRDPDHERTWVALVDGLCGPRDYAATGRWLARNVPAGRRSAQAVSSSMAA